MNHYLVDYTREYLIAAAAYAANLRHDDMSIQIVATPASIVVRACAGGIHKTWLDQACDWEDVAKARENPLPAVIDGLLFRLARQCEKVTGKVEDGRESDAA